MPSDFEDYYRKYREALEGAVVEDYYKKSKIRELITAFLIMMGGVFLTWTAWGTYRVANQRGHTEKEVIANVRALKVESLAYQQSIQELKNRLDAQAAPLPDNAIADEIKKISGSLTGLEKRMKALEDAIQESPEKSLAIPLLRKDIETMQTRLEDSKKDQQLHNEQLYSLLVWVIGGIGALLIAILVSGGGAVWNYFGGFSLFRKRKGSSDSAVTS